MSASSSAPAVEIVDLTMHYGRGAAVVKAVDGLSLTVEAGTVTSILGPNGAGKTTTIETCEGFRRPQSGTVRVLGLDPVADAPRLRARVGVMLQSGGAWLGVRAGEMLRHVAALHAHPLDVDALVERLGMERFARTPYRRLSGGQKQRLSLAMAIVGRPELVFLDEPTAGLDPMGREEMLALVARLGSFGISVLLATHLLDDVQQVCDHVVMLDAGRLVVEGATGALLETTGTLVLDVGPDRAALVAALVARGLAAAEVGGLVEVRDAGDDALDVVRDVVADLGLPLHRMTSGLTSLDEVFLTRAGSAAGPPGGPA